MASKQSKTSLLSDKLEFEDVSQPSSAQQQELPDEIKAAIEAAEQSDKTTAEKNITGTSKSKLVSSNKVPQTKPEKQKNGGVDKTQLNDKFTWYAATVALLTLIAILTSTFIYKRVVQESEAPGYVVLPQGVANIDGQIIRMQITIQVKDADKDWLIENKRMLSNLFQIELAKLNLDELKTEQALDEARERMRINLNKAMASDKIEAVLINEFLSQNND